MSNRNSFIESTKETDERLEALKQLYPEIFSDGKINLDAFKDVTGTSDLPEGQDRTPGYYGLYWPGKRAAKQLARKEAEGTLEPVPGDGVNEDTTHNIYIEGDNLEVLRILKQSYKGRVKMIYIDPPYNTGNDFIYPDDFKMPVEEYLKMTGQADESGKRLVTNQKSNGSFHTNWLNMMYPRLQLARELLTEDGVIFISIDDNEQSNLKLLCDDVFGEENFIADFIWKSKLGKVGTTSTVSATHEYIICYSKNIEKVEFKMIENHNEGRKENLRQWGVADRREDRPSMFYPIEINGKTVLPIKEDGTEGRWRVGEETAAELLAQGVLELSEKDGKLNIYRSFPEGVSYTSYDTLLLEEIGTTAKGAVALKNLNMAKMFDFSKPVELIKHFAEISTQISNDSKNSPVILDFFSGSATTAHAVMELNKEDNGNRKFVMVQLPHKCEENSEAAKAGYSNICEIGKERIRRAGAKILEEAKANKDMFSEDYQLDIGFKVYRLQNSNFVKYTPVEGQDEDSQNKLFEEFEKNQIPLVQGWKAENVLTEIILKQGFALDCTKEKVDSFKKNTIWKITDSADAVSKKIKLYVCLDNSIEEETIKNLTLNDDEKFICLDAAIDDSAYARLADKGRIETI